MIEKEYIIIFLQLRWLDNKIFIQLKCDSGDSGRYTKSLLAHFYVCDNSVRYDRLCEVKEGRIKV